MTRFLMKCGHVDNATCKGKPACAICSCLEVEREVQGTDGLNGREAHCAYCRSRTKSRWELPFFEYQPKFETDTYYCGCRGWD